MMAGGTARKAGWLPMTEATCPDCDAAHELLDALDAGECPVCGTAVKELHMLAITEDDD